MKPNPVRILKNDRKAKPSLQAKMRSKTVLLIPSTVPDNLNDIFDLNLSLESAQIKFIAPDGSEVLSMSLSEVQTHTLNRLSIADGVSVQDVLVRAVEEKIASIEGKSRAGRAGQGTKKGGSR